MIDTLAHMATQTNSTTADYRYQAHDCASRGGRILRQGTFTPVANGIIRLFSIAVLISCSAEDAVGSQFPEQWLEASAARDAATLWSMLSPTDRADVVATYERLKVLHMHVGSVAKKAEHAPLREMLMDLKALTGPEAFFAWLVSRAGDPMALSTFERLGATVVSREPTGAGVRLRTIVGDSIHVEVAEGQPYVCLTSDDRGRLQSLSGAVHAWSTALERQREEVAQKRF